MSIIPGVFQSLRTILCVCPHCNDILRLSDLHLSYKGKAPRTWLDAYDKETITLEEKEEEFDEKEDGLREVARERGRVKVPKLVRKSMNTEFAKLGYDPYDIKALLHPVDFVVFDGMNDKEEIDNVVFLSTLTKNNDLAKLRKSVKSTIAKRNYDWQVARVNINGKIEYDKA